MQKRTKALAIPREVKDRVYKRDGGLCVLCRRPGVPNAHIVSRAQGGLGIEENIVTLCPDCHRLYDQSVHREILRREIMDYMRRKYPGWDDISLTYKKGG